MYGVVLLTDFETCLWGCWKLKYIFCLLHSYCLQKCVCEVTKILKPLQTYIFPWGFEQYANFRSILKTWVWSFFVYHTGKVEVSVFVFQRNKVGHIPTKHMNVL